jgi:hypothetical protein
MTTEIAPERMWVNKRLHVSVVEGIGYRVCTGELDGSEVEYVRADILATLTSQRDELQAELGATRSALGVDKEAMKQIPEDLRMICPGCKKEFDHSETFSWGPDSDGHPTVEQLFCPHCGASTEEPPSWSVFSYREFEEATSLVLKREALEASLAALTSERDALNGEVEKAAGYKKAATLVGIEWGYIQCEKGVNLESAIDGFLHPKPEEGK